MDLSSNDGTMHTLKIYTRKHIFGCILAASRYKNRKHFHGHYILIGFGESFNVSLAF